MRRQKILLAHKHHTTRGALVPLGHKFHETLVNKIAFCCHTEFWVCTCLTVCQSPRIGRSKKKHGGLNPCGVWRLQKRTDNHRLEKLEGILPLNCCKRFTSRMLGCKRVSTLRSSPCAKCMQGSCRRSSLPHGVGHGMLSLSFYACGTSARGGYSCITCFSAVGKAGADKQCTRVSDFDG